MMKTTLALSIALGASLTCAAFNGVDKPIKYTVDPVTGVKYHFFKQDKKGSKPADGDVATVIMMYKNYKDSIIFDSRKSANRRPGDTTKTVMIPLKKSFNGCLEQGISMMSVGDSAVFSISADSLFLKTFRAKALPAFATAGSFFTFYIKLVKFQTQQQLQEEKQQKIVQQQMEMAKRKAEENQTIAKYLSDNNIKVQPTADSLFVLERKGATGKAVEDGDSLYVSYTGMQLNGKVFDASEKHGGPLKLVYSQSMQLIKGWVEMLGTMHEGESAKILVPSSLGYGAHQMGPDLLPYTPMLFELQVVKVKSNK